jgi:phage baseplate assembly protein W
LTEHLELLDKVKYIMAERNLYKTVSVSSSNKENAVRSKTYRGLSTVNPNRKNFKAYDLDLIKQDIINHFHIRQGEKLSDPTFGTIIWDILYEPLTSEIQEAIVKNVTDIINYDPRVNVNNITVRDYESGIDVQCTLTYLPYNISETVRLKFDQQNGLL